MATDSEGCGTEAPVSLATSDTTCAGPTKLHEQTREDQRAGSQGQRARGGGVNGFPPSEPAGPLLQDVLPTGRRVPEHLPGEGGGGMRDGLEGWRERGGPHHGTHRTHDPGCQCVGGWRSIDGRCQWFRINAFNTLGVALCAAFVAVVESMQRKIATINPPSQELVRGEGRGTREPAVVTDEAPALGEGLGVAHHLPDVLPPHPAVGGTPRPPPMGGFPLDWEGDTLA